MHGHHTHDPIILGLATTGIDSVAHHGPTIISFVALSCTLVSTTLNVIGFAQRTLAARKARKRGAR